MFFSMDLIGYILPLYQVFHGLVYPNSFPVDIFFSCACCLANACPVCACCHPTRAWGQL